MLKSAIMCCLVRCLRGPRIWTIGRPVLELGVDSSLFYFDSTAATRDFEVDGVFGPVMWRLTGEKLVDGISHSGLTQAEVARRMGTMTPAVARLEGGAA